MRTRPKPDLAVTALLHNLNDELDRNKMKKMEDLVLAKMQSSLDGGLGQRINKKHAQINDWRGGRKLCGAIFMCNRRTWKECLGQSLFGLPIGKKNLVKQVMPGMKLFLFEYERRQLWGVFEAASYGEMDIIPNAYTGGSFPCQVRVNVPEECVALYEEEFFEAIMDNYFSIDKFHFDLSEKQVCHLTSLFERKYLSANIMHSNLLKYEDKRYISGGRKSNGGLPLLLTNDATCLYPQDLLQRRWYSSSCQVTNGPFLLNSEKSRDRPDKNGEGRSGCKSSEKSSLIALPNGALDIVQSNVTSLTGELGKGFDIVNASCLTFYDSNNRSIVEDLATGETIFFSDDVSRLHSDRPTGKSVWARLSGHSKSFVELDSIQAKKSLEVTPVITLPPKACTILEIDVDDENLVQDQYVCRANVSEEAAEEYSVCFKRRRTTNNNASANVDETPSKRRRKLKRPSFDVVPDEHLVEHGKYVAEKTTLPSARGGLDFSRSSSTVGTVENLVGNIAVPTEFPMNLEVKVCDVSKFPLSDPRERTIGMNAPGSNQGNGILQSAHNVCQPNTLDLNLPVEASFQNDQGVAIVLDNLLVLKDGKQCSADATASKVSGITEAGSQTRLEQHTEPLNERGPSSFVCKMQQEPCCLALSLATQETVFHSREYNNIADLTGGLQRQPAQALALVEDTEHNKPLSVDGPEIFIGQSKQRGRASREGGTDFLGKEEQSSDLQPPHISSESKALDLATADSLRASSFSLGPCSPAKDFLDSSYAFSEHCDDRKGFSHDVAQDIPLTLEVGNGAQLGNVKLCLGDIVHPERASGNLHRREDGDDAAVQDECFNGHQSIESNTIALNCTSGRNSPNQVDLKSILSGLQVSGIRLHLGASPRLILQLGDLAGFTSNVDGQDQGGEQTAAPDSS